MSSIVVGFVALAFLFGATMAGILSQRRLPQHHLTTESRDAIKLATAVVGTLSALALGLLISSAKSAHETAEGELRTAAGHLVLLDRTLARYGAETEEARALLRELATERLNQTWGEVGDSPEVSTNSFTDGRSERLQGLLRGLEPTSESQRKLTSQALDIGSKIVEDNWLMMEAEDEGLPGAFLGILIFWLSLLFATFGLLAPRNPTVVAVLFLCALSVSGAVYLITDMAHPYLGLITISDMPLQAALRVMGQ
jgi:hypothetical protein